MPWTIIARYRGRQETYIPFLQHTPPRFDTRERAEVVAEEERAEAKMCGYAVVVEVVHTEARIHKPPEKAQPTITIDLVAAALEKRGINPLLGVFRSDAAEIMAELKIGPRKFTPLLRELKEALKASGQ